MGKKGAVGGLSLQKSTSSKSLYHPLITPSVVKAVSKTVASIDRVLAGEKKTAISIGELLGKLRTELSTHLKKSGQSANDKRINRAFCSFVQVRFKIGDTQANEYLRLAERKDLHRLDLPVSVLIELARLDAVKLAEFRKLHPTKELKKLDVKSIKRLVRESNENKRTVVPKVKEPKSETPQVIAESLKTTFEKVRDQFDDKPTLDKGIATVLKEISKWYLDKAD